MGKEFMKEKNNIIEEDKDISSIQKTYDFMHSENLTYLEVKIKDSIIKIKRYEKKESATNYLLSSLLLSQRAGLGLLHEKVTTLPPKTESPQTCIPVKAPLTGTFYRAPAPNRPPFVEKGQVVEKGQILCIIEAMKVMNEIPAPLRCKIEDILVENGVLVNADQELFLVVPM